ncbi:hypothetical protein [Aquimarina sp. AU474]|uniref:hypothetical protein n=1 Tax=Aquimarina sp. AU474 TaxID=2108529 RepID=UPI00135CE2ED|nr:hypothetical protein [Aquimarina sp. AU474]
MKKQNLKNLALNKNMISRLKQGTITGGNDNQTHPCNLSVERNVPCHFDYKY